MAHRPYLRAPPTTAVGETLEASIACPWETAGVMSHTAHYIGPNMGVGRSGRIVIEVEPLVKRELYAALARQGLTLKEWFLQSASVYLTEGSQLALPLGASDTAGPTGPGQSFEKKGRG